MKKKIILKYNFLQSTSKKGLALNSIFFFFIFLFPFHLQSQIPWNWANDANSSSDEKASAVAIDPTNGDVVTVGIFSGDISANYGAEFIGSPGGGYVTKQNSNGALIWAFKIGNENDDACNGVAVDASGNIFVTGYLSGTTEFKGLAVPSTTLASIGSKDVFVAKYNSNGSLIWVKRGGGFSNDEGSSICLNQSGSQILVTGYYSNGGNFGGLITFANQSTENIFVISYNQSGTEQWLSDAGSGNDALGRSIIADNSNVYIIGDHLNSTLLIYDNLGFNVANLTNANPGTSNIFITSYQLGGSFNWVKKIESPGSDYGRGITQSGSKVYLTGSFSNGADFPSYFANPVASTGDLDFFVAELDKTTGNSGWVNAEAGSLDQQGMAITCDGNNDLFVSGQYNNSMAFTGGPTLISAGQEDVFVMSYKTSGLFNWAQTAGDNGTDIAYGIAVTNTSTEIYTAGEYANSAVFGTFTLTNASGANIFSAKLSCDPIINNSVTATQTICYGQTPAMLSGSITTGGSQPYIYLWQQSLNNVTWAAAAGTNNSQDYFPPALNVSTYYRRIVTSSGGCNNFNNSSSILISVDNLPTTALAGSGQTLCSTSGTLGGNTPTVGIGLWTLLGGGISITSPGLPNSGFTGLAVGVNTLQWSITNGVCPASTATVLIQRDDLPTLANAGPSQSLCSNAGALSGNTPLVGTGLWSVVVGTVSITTPTLETSAFTGLALGTHTLNWTISNGVCPSSSSTLSILRVNFVTTSLAGTNQTICSSSGTLAGNTPTVGNGLWTLVGGTLSITNPTSPTSPITGIAVGTHTLMWTISNGICSPSSSTVEIQRDAVPTTAMAGLNQTVCATTATLTGNTPLIGTGLWSLLVGTLTIDSPLLPGSTVSSMSPGINVLQWTISNGVCPPSSSAVQIKRDDFPTPSVAGPNQTVCASTGTLGGNTPTVGIGFWTLLGGTVTVINPTLSTSGFSGMPVGLHLLDWTISNGVCPSSSSTVLIQRDAFPTNAIAGPNQTICATTGTLSANTPTIGTGLWSVIVGTVNITSPSSPSSLFSALAVGVHTLGWNITNGVCPPSTSTIILQHDDFPTPSFAGPTQTVCAPNGTLAGNSPIVGTGLWAMLAGTISVTTPTLSNSQFSGLAVGTSTLQWTISNGVCPPSSSTVSVSRDNYPTPSVAGPNQTICATTTTLAGNTPTIGTGMWALLVGTLTINTPTLPNSVISLVAAGIHTLQWSIVNGVCPPSNDKVSIQRDDFPTPSVAGPDQTICTTTAVLAGNTPTSGTGLWTLVGGGLSIITPTNPVSSVTAVAVGTNVLQWTISNGICPPSSSTVAILRDDFPTISVAGPNQTICATSGVLGGNTPIVGNGLWTLLSGLLSITTPTFETSAITGIAVGVNVLDWTISNGVCPPSSSTVSIERVDFPTTALAGPDQTICATSGILAGNTPIIGTGSWAVLVGAASVTTPTLETSPFTALAVGANILEWSINYNVCPPSTSTVLVQRDDFPTTALAGPNQTICAASGVLSGNTPTVGTGLWTVQTGTLSITTPTIETSAVTGVAIGTHTLDWTISNGVCPPSSSTVTLTRLDAPTTAVAGPNQTLCATSGTLAANDATVGTGLWTVIGGAASINSPTFSASTFTALAVGANILQWSISYDVCPPSTSTVLIQRDDLPTLSAAGPSQTYCAVTGTLPGNVPLVGTGLWSLVSGTLSVTTPTLPSSTVTGLAIGTHTLNWTINNGVCPPSSSTVSVERIDFPTMAVAGPSQTLCATTGILAANTPTIGNGFWSVIGGSVSITTLTSPASTFSNLAVGSNTLQWNITYGVCPINSSTIIIQRDEAPSVSDAGNNITVCALTTSLNGSVPSVGTGTWVPIGIGPSVTAVSNPNSTVTFTNEGIYRYKWIIGNGVCPTNEDSVKITTYALPAVASAGPDQKICANTVSLSANLPAIGSCTWIAINGSAAVADPNNNHTFVNFLNQGIYSYVWSNTHGNCPAVNDTVVIQTFSNPTRANAGTDITSDINSVNLAANDPLVGVGAWSIINGSGDLSNINSPQSAFEITSDGRTDMVWTITNGVCPASSDTLFIFINSFLIPEVITPNGDGSNDVFEIKAFSKIDGVKIKIYNRWGNIVFESNNYKNDFGGINSAGHKLADDTYYYLLNAEEKNYKGFFKIKTN